MVLCFGTSLLANNEASKGVLDLSNQDFKSSGIICLLGEWEIYPGQVLSPSDFANAHVTQPFYGDLLTEWSSYKEFPNTFKEFGNVTYRLEVIMPNEFPGQNIFLKRVNSSYRLFVNGEELIEMGTIAHSEEQAKPAWGLINKVLNLQPGKNEIVIQVSNFSHAKGGFDYTVQMGPSEELNVFSELEVGGILFLLGCLLLAGTFALGLFWFRTTDVTGLFFFLFCVFYACWKLNTEYHLLDYFFQDLTWSFTIRFKYIALIAAVTSYAYFLARFFSEFVSIRLAHSLSVINAVYLALTLLAPIWLTTAILPFYISILGLYLVALAIIIVPTSNFVHKLAWVNTLGFMALGVVVVEKLLVLYNLSSASPLINIGANALFVFSQALGLAVRFGRNYRESAAAALAAARTRDEFLNTMSHELKTPMNAILGMSTFLEKSELNAEQRYKLKAIKENGQSLMGLITDVLSMSEVGTGHIKLKKSTLNIESCIDSVVSLSKQHLKSQRVVFASEIDESIPDFISGDSSRLKQILMHLLSNAFKFTEKGRVDLKVHRLNTEKNEVRLRFEIIDTGIGMSSKGRSKLMSVFTQGDAGNTRKQGGIGLGLPLVSELVELMDGEFSIKSKKGAGTTVTVDIGFEEHEMEGPRLTSIFERNEVDTSLKVLYAEDNPVNQKLISMMMQTLGMKVDIAKDGVEAVKMASKKYYNIILMDIQMPNMDGIEATKRIIDSCIARPIIVATTANMAAIDQRKCFEAGMNDFMAKPVHMDDLKLTFIKWQGLKKYLDVSGTEYLKLPS